MTTYQQQRGMIADMQKDIDAINRQFENPAITYADRRVLGAQLAPLMKAWYDAMVIMHAMPEYKGAFRFEKDNNPYA
ncbi:hypothetical protein O197_31 [Edwardsiella phage eiAU-183]|uniref:Uncharacterized protein eiAUOrf43 n=2 Tax=Eiauvirus eiAU TaxID=1982112 RepID=E7EKT2_9CAUD|nr:hypothetical protein CH09_gp31 [Edwardsiella phage eiAU-183]YP_009613881.1 hypothetical protein FDI58_gp31 [Edwardsiella phage eiAU]ADV36437.1 unknown [Edwardsiella phage eiAU]AHG23447.1 hypothetical protein P858_31 [Edwardsiella phage eiAU]AHG23501.1 hypothetical protein O197_31 [Edwardsiella phage eiAU-183]